MAIYPQPTPPGGTGAEIDPGRRFGFPSRDGLDASQYSGSTSMRPAEISGFGQNAQAVASGSWVYWGRDTKNGKDRFLTTSQANNAWFGDEKIKSRVTEIMNSAFGEGEWTFGKAQYYWNQAVSGSNYGLYVNNQYLQPLDLLPSVIGEEAKKRGGAGGGGGPTRTTQIRLTDPQGARALIDNALTQYLGRRASASEQAAFLKALNAQEARNPTVTTSAGGGGGATVVTTGGFNPSTFAQDYAQGMEGSAEFQAATTYLDAFIQALRPVV